MKREYEDDLRDMVENAEKALSFVRGINYKVIWRTVQEDLTTILPLLKKMLN